MPTWDLVTIFRWVVTAAALAVLVAALAYAFGSIAGYGGAAIAEIQAAQKMPIGNVEGRSFVLYFIDVFADPTHQDAGGGSTAGWVAILQPFAIGLGILTIAVFAWKFVQAVLK